MEFVQNGFLKPIISGVIGNNPKRLLIDTGSDWMVLSVPYYHEKDGRIVPIYESKEDYYAFIRDNFGSFVRKADGTYIQTTIHGFGNTQTVCRLLSIKSFSLGDDPQYCFTDSYAFLDEQTIGRPFDMIVGTPCLRNFQITLDYEEKSIDFHPKSKELHVNYKGIVPTNSGFLENGIAVPPDIYLLDYYG